MARYRLHCIGASGNSFKVALFLNCAGLDWEPVGLDFAGGETRTPDWRAATNVMGEVPVLEVDGRHMSQSGAILLWLAETHGVFRPTQPIDLPEGTEVEVSAPSLRNGAASPQNKDDDHDAIYAILGRRHLRFDLPLQGVRFGDARPIGSDDTDAAFGEMKCHGAAKAAAGAGDECDLVGHVCLSETVIERRIASSRRSSVSR